MVPGAKTSQFDAPRYRILPCVDPMVSSRIAVIVLAIGVAEPPEMLAKISWLAMLANESVPVVVIGPPVRPVPAATLVTVPVPVTVVHVGLAAAACVVRT